MKNILAIAYIIIGIFMIVAASNNWFIASGVLFMIAGTTLLERGRDRDD